MTRWRVRRLSSSSTRATREGGAGYVPRAERVAVFDNDGTLWCEKPMPIAPAVKQPIDSSVPSTGTLHSQICQKYDLAQDIGCGGDRPGASGSPARRTDRPHPPTEHACTHVPPDEAAQIPPNHPIHRGVVPQGPLGDTHTTHPPDPTAVR
jgi:hypothetical protein